MREQLNPSGTSHSRDATTGETRALIEQLQQRADFFEHRTQELETRLADLLDQVRHQSLHDDLTGLPNRVLILDRAEQMLARARRTPQPVAALFVDLDNFKDVNDTLGHHVGDQLLRAVAERMVGALRATDTIARVGGDEFVVLTEGVALAAGPELVAERLADVLRTPFHVGSGVPITLTASIGIALGDRASAGDLLRDADIALWRAKGAGKNRHVVFDPAMQREMLARVGLEMDLRAAVEDKSQLFLVYQPVFSLDAVNASSVEALLRWMHPTRRVVEPNDFIPLLEGSGMIGDVGRWVLHQACSQTASWREAGRNLAVSVNVSVRQLETDAIVDDVYDALAASGLPPEQLTLEVTETALMRDTDATVRRLGMLKQLGVRLAIDDFGTGYSSFAYLRQFPVDALKIDRSFIGAMLHSRESTTIISMLIDLGRSLGLEMHAEGIEDRDQLRLLQQQRCDSGQGFLLSRPLRVEAIEQLLTRVDQMANSATSTGTPVP